MIQGIICTDEIAKASNNTLNEFCNFNDVFTWNKPSGGANATIINNIGGRQSYYGLGCVSLNFTGTSEVSFDAGGSDMQLVVQRTGNYILSYAFDKDDNNADINFTVEVYVNSVLQPNNTITQNLFDSSGFTNEKWNVYFQYLFLSYSDVIDFSFKAQSDTTACTLYFDRLKLEIDNKGFGLPTIYTEVPLAVIEEENTITVGAITANSSVEITASLTGALLTSSSKGYVAMKYPEELLTLGLVVGYPIITADNVVKFIIHNKSGGSITPTAMSIYNFKLIRE